MQKDFVENCQKFSGFVRQVPQKGLKKKNTVKNAWDQVSTALEFIQTRNYYSFLKPPYSFDLTH